MSIPHTAARLMMYDGSTKTVDEIVRDSDAGQEQVLVGDDSAPRHVLPGSAVRSAGQLYRIQSTKEGYDEWVCDAGHVLVLKFNVKPRVLGAGGRWTVRGYELVPGDDDNHQGQRSMYPKDRIIISGLASKQDALAFMASRQWTPLVFECTVRDFLSIKFEFVRQRCMMFQPGLIHLAPPSEGRRLRNLLSSAGAPGVITDELVRLTAWILGVWITDGSAGLPIIHQIGEDVNRPTRCHQPVLDQVHRWLRAVHPDETEQHTSARFNQVKRRTTAGNILYLVSAGTVLGKLLDLYGLRNNKHLPPDLLREPADTRTSLLEGIIDGDGYLDRSRTYEVAAKDRQVIEGYAHLCRGLGFSTGKVASHVNTNKETGKKYPGWRIHISGADISKLMPVLTYKRCERTNPNKDQRCHGFTLAHFGTGEYSGFQLDANGRCLLSDGTVVNRKRSRPSD